MKAIPLKKNPDGNGHIQCSIQEATHVQLNMPGPLPFRLIPIQLSGSRNDIGNWSWNGDTELPTLHPSILSTYNHKDGEIRCHTFVNDGKAQYLSDCSHELAGQTVELLDAIYGEFKMVR